MEKIKFFILTLLCMVGIMHVCAQEQRTIKINNGTGAVTGHATWKSNEAFLNQTNDDASPLTVTDNDATRIGLGWYGLSVNGSGLVVHPQITSTHYLTISAPEGWVLKSVSFTPTSSRNVVLYNSEECVLGVMKTISGLDDVDVNIAVKHDNGLAGDAYLYDFSVIIEKIPEGEDRSKLDDVKGHWSWVSETPIDNGVYKIVNQKSLRIAAPDGKSMVSNIASGGDYWWKRANGNLYLKCGDTYFDAGVTSIGDNHTFTIEGNFIRFNFGTNVYVYAIGSRILHDTSKRNDQTDEWFFYSVEQARCYVDFKHTYNDLERLVNSASISDEEKAKINGFISELGVFSGDTEEARANTRSKIKEMEDLIIDITGIGENNGVVSGTELITNANGDDSFSGWAYSRVPGTTGEFMGRGAHNDGNTIDNSYFDLRNAIMSQNVSGLKNGLWRVSCCYQAASGTDVKFTAKTFVNEKTVDNLPATGISGSASNNSGSISEYWEPVVEYQAGKSGWYKVTTPYVVVVNGCLSIQVSANTGDDLWCNVDKFELEYIAANHCIDGEDGLTRIYEGAYNENPEIEVTDSKPYADMTNAYYPSGIVPGLKHTNPNGLFYARNNHHNVSGDEVYNVIKGAEECVCQNLKLFDKHPYSTKTQFDASDAKYNMTSFGMGADNEGNSITFGTMMLPYAVSIPSDSGVKVYSVGGVSEDGNLSLTEEQSVAANIPYLVEYTGSDNPLFKAESKNVSVSVEGIGQLHSGSMLVGAYQLTEVENDGTNYLLQKQNGKLAFYRVATAGLNVGPFRCYLHVPSTVNAPSKINIVFDDEATGITEVENADCADVVYDIQGRRVEDVVCPGIYVKNGKKCLVK